jgi:hypothetical protein
VTDAKPGQMHGYYQARGLSPTFGNLHSTDDLERHAADRARLFTDRLHLPPRLFRDARVLEFGPDTAENALVFAKWGATVDLVEPNRQAWPQIEAYFRQHGLEASFGGLDGTAIQDFVTRRAYDVVVAEGFIHTVQPASSWIATACPAVAPGGFLVLFYYERSAILVELFHRAMHVGFGRLSGQATVETARQLFGTKWEAIPHVRRFESWVMDVLENPYTSVRYTLDAQALIVALSNAGFDLYQSWPRYRDELRMAWHKAPERPEEMIAETARHLPRLAIAHALGKSLFAHGPEADIVAVRDRLDGLLGALESVIHADASGAWQRISEALDALGRCVSDPTLYLAPTPGIQKEAEAALSSLATVARLLASGLQEKVIAFASTDPVFRKTWGQPAHYAVFRRADRIATR